MGVSQRVNMNINIIIEYQNVYDQRPRSGIKEYDSSLMFEQTLFSQIY